MVWYQDGAGPSTRRRWCSATTTSLSSTSASTPCTTRAPASRRTSPKSEDGQVGAAERLARLRRLHRFPWAYNGKVFALSESGDTYVLDSAKGFEVVGTNSLEEAAMSSPAMARGSLFIRTRSNLWRLTEGAKPVAAPTGQ